MEKDIKRFDYWFSHNYQELRNKLYGAFFNEDPELWEELLEVY